MWDSTVFNDAEEVGNWGNQIEFKQPFLFHSDNCYIRYLLNPFQHTANKYRVQSTPTYIFFKEGTELRRVIHHELMIM